MDRINFLENIIIRASKTYYGENIENPIIISDAEFDAYVDELTQLDHDNETLKQIGTQVVDESRKEELPIYMASMNKVKSYEELKRWFKLKGIPEDTELVVSGKFDGVAFCSKEDTGYASSRGNGVIGQRSDDHLKMIKPKMSGYDEYTIGEVIMKRDTFLTKYAEDYENPRNLVSGLINKDEPSEILADCDFIRFGLVARDLDMRFFHKCQVFEYLNSFQREHPVSYLVTTLAYLTDDKLKELYLDWCKDYELDGIILEVNDLKLADQLGRETSTNNPVYARAYKGAFEEVKETTVTALDYGISKHGVLNPVIHVEPVRCDGATVRKITGNNAKFIKDMGIGVGAKITVKRSGMVIPMVVQVLEPVEFTIPDVGVPIIWDEKEIQLLTTEVTPEQEIKRIVSFFRILEVENVSDGICEQLYHAGFKTIKDILLATREDFEKIDRFGERKAEITHTAIHTKMKEVSLHKLQHATGFFNPLGSKKLRLVNHLENPTFEQLMEVDGFSEISANAYLDNIDRYNAFIADLGELITVKVEEYVPLGSGLKDMVFVFTGIRSKELESRIQEHGGRIASGVSKKTTHLVMKAKGSGSGKEKKALNLGQTILDVQELTEMLNQLDENI